MQLKFNNYYKNNQQSDQQQQYSININTTTTRAAAAIDCSGMATSLLNVAGGSLINANSVHRDSEVVVGSNVDAISRCSRGSNNNNNNSFGNNNISHNNNYNIDDSCSSTTAITKSATALDANDIKQKRQILEQRKQELEKLLSEKTWILHQLQKQELQILQGNYEYVNLNEIFGNLTQQYKLEQQQKQQNVSIAITMTATTATIPVTITSTTTHNISNRSSLLRRKATPCNNNNKNNINNNNNRQSDISNRSSEYDNYPCVSALDCDEEIIVTTTLTPTPSNKILLGKKKRATPTAHLNLATSTANLNYAHLQHQHTLQQQAERHMLQQHLQHQQQDRKYHVAQTADAVSLYSVNSSNVATLRQQHVAPQQQPIIVQYEKYCLSPTHQTYTDGGFIKSSQNIKRYVSPLSSPHHQAKSKPQQHQTIKQLQQRSKNQSKHQPTHIISYQQIAPTGYFRPLDAISLAPSYLSVHSNSGMLDDDSAQVMRWRSQSNTLLVGGLSGGTNPTQETSRSNSSDKLSYYSVSNAPGNAIATTALSKHLDEISISSLSSENQRKQIKPKMWLESSLDGPVLRTPVANINHIPTTATTVIGNYNEEVTSMATRYMPDKLAGHKKLSSQSMCAGSSGRHYSMSVAQKHMYSMGGAVNAAGVGKLLQDEGTRFMKLSQSTSYLNALEAQHAATPNSYQPYDVAEAKFCQQPAAITSQNYRYLPPKPAQRTNTPPRPPPAVDKLLASVPKALPAAETAIVQNDCTSPMPAQDIRLESPKNMTVITQATFQPYKEVTKPFEMSDFYKYSTKFRQKDGTGDTTAI